MALASFFMALAPLMALSNGLLVLETFMTWAFMVFITFMELGMAAQQWSKAVRAGCKAWKAKMADYAKIFQSHWGWKCAKNKAHGAGFLKSQLESS